MTDHDFDDTADLGARLTQLTEARPEPPDPAAPVRVRINQRRRRRAGLAFAGVAAATALAVMTGSTIAGALSGNREPGVAGFGPSTSQAPTPGGTPSTPGPATGTPENATGTATPGTVSGAPTPGVSQGPSRPSVDHQKVLPPPWSAKPFTKLPDANAYRPRAYYIAEGQIPTERWALLAYSTEACLVADEGAPSSFGVPHVCFPKATAKSFHVVQGHNREKGSVKIGHTMVMGVAPITARKVRITAQGGVTRLADAVATPSTDKLRYFGVVIPRNDLRGVTITPLDASGNEIAVPAS
ncbi:hypothetical protein [Kribbella sp. NPDC023855]|uniref:hypothetical protein n=1 Tax=Kribbella sp. NPDC023855 TaxID=3154698 RepID=UPI0033DC9060